MYFLDIAGSNFDDSVKILSINAIFECSFGLIGELAKDPKTVNRYFHYLTPENVTSMESVMRPVDSNIIKRFELLQNVIPQV